MPPTAAFSYRPIQHGRAPFYPVPHPRGLAAQTSPLTRSRTAMCEARSPQVMELPDDCNQTPFLQKVLKTIVLVPALGLALISYNRSFVYTPRPSLPEVQLSSLKEVTTEMGQAPAHATASISSGIQKAHINTLVTVSAILLVFGFQAARKKTARNSSALSALGNSVRQDGSTIQRRNTRFSFPFRRRQLHASTSLEMRTDVDLDSASKEVAQESANEEKGKFDFAATVLKGKWQEDNQTLEKIPRWDPISALHAAAGNQDKPGVNKYDLLGAVFSQGCPSANNASANGASSGSNAAFDAIPGWDPVSGIQSAARNTEKSDSNRYDMVEDVLRGNWQSEIARVENLPAWDPISGLVNFAREAGLQMDSKFDVMSAVLQGEWQTQNSSLNNLPGWDPTGKLIQVATDEKDPVENSKYDAAAGLLAWGGKNEEEEDAPSTEEESNSAVSVEEDQEKKMKQAARDLEKSNILESITLFMKELESVQEVETLKA